MLLLTALGAYLIGSIPFGLILTRLAGLGDIRAIGSGNIGATNVLRTGNKWLALATLALDFGKGFVPIFILRENSSYLAYLVENKELALYNLLLIPLAVAVGHMFPIWLKFKGGKAVACIFGLTYAISWEIGLVVSGLWLTFFFLSGFSSLAAIFAIPGGWVIGVYAHYYPWWLAICMIMPTLLMIIKHHENIRRLLKGEEHRFSFSSKSTRHCEEE